MGQGNYKEKVIYSKEIPDSNRPGYSSIYVHPDSKPGLFCELPSGASTLYESFRSSAIKLGNNNFLGKFSEKSNQYSWKSYLSIYKYSLTIGYGLAYLKLTEPTEEGQAFLGIYSKNREEWLITDLACISQSIVTVPIYDVQQLQSMEFIISETRMRGIVCSNKLLRNLLHLRKNGSVDSIRTIIQFEKVTDDDRTRASCLGLNLFSLKEVSEMVPIGRGSENPPYPDSWFTICYTSGTTGRSKGAVITHRNIISTIAGVFYTSLRLAHEDVYLSYLPLAHMMERAVCHLIISVGGSMGFYRGDTSKLTDDLVSLRPTIFMSVPRIYKRFYEDINRTIEASSPAKQKLIKNALSVKLENYESKGKYTHKIWDRLVFKRFRAMLGGRVKVMVTGSAAISEEILKFLRVVFSCAVIEGYGQTESCAGSVLTNVSDTSIGHIGGPIVNVEVKIVDDEEMGYRCTDVDEVGAPAPRGEICLRGPTVFQGYFKAPEETALALDEEGWLHTGDIGTILPGNRALKLLDRKKNYFKLAQGEFVAAEKIEQAYATCPYVFQIFVHGDSIQNYLVAVVVVNEANVKEQWRGRDGETVGIEEICRNKEVNREVLECMNGTAREHRLLGFEYVKKIYLESCPWTHDDLLTPTHKIIRYKVRSRYSEIIALMYSQGL